MWIRLRNVNRVTAKGKVYFYHRITGERLPAEAGAREKRVLEINLGVKPNEPLSPGSVNELVALYRSSPDYQNTRPKTRKDYLRYLDWIKEKWGDLPVCEIDREAIIEARNGLKSKPRTADYLVAVIRRLLTFAVDRPRQFGLSANPALQIERIFTTEGYSAWPDPVIAEATGRAYPELAKVVLLGLYTGQRGQDCVRMLWSHYDGSGIEVAQEKTGKRLWIPAHKELRAVLDRMPRTAAVICVNRQGKPWKLDHLRHEIRDLMRPVGRFSFHGLRKAAAKRMAEAGCSAHQISAITGQSLQMVEHYTRSAEQKKMAKAAVRKLERKRDDFAKPTDGPAKPPRTTR